MNTQPDGPGPERLRTPPSERFTGPSHLISLRSALEELRAEKHPARNGHRQITLFHRAPVTQVLFSFARGGHLDEHAAHGVVTIHVLEGCLRVEVAGGKNELPAGHLLILDPDVPHDVYASEESAMLLTVHLQTE
jgi:quercetin dioxygenase-like cupin family protein